MVNRQGVIYISALVAFAIGAPLLGGQLSQAYDMPELIDSPRTATQKSIEPQVYRFAELQMKNVTYSNGNVYPTMTAELQKYNFTSQQWETFGYVNTHLHNVKVDGTDVVDVSVGHTDRINPKR